MEKLNAYIYLIMSLQNALKLIHKVRKENSEAISDLTCLEELVELSKTYGLVCSADELQFAFYTDWKMRWANVQECTPSK